MKVTVFGSHLCPDTLYALCKLKDIGADVTFKNLSASFIALKEFLLLRESNPMYKAIKQNGGIGIPFFEAEDGTQTLDLHGILLACRKD